MKTKWYRVAWQMQDVAAGVPKEELERAKMAAMSSVYMNLESPNA